MEFLKVSSVLLLLVLLFHRVLVDEVPGTTGSPRRTINKDWYRERPIKQAVGPVWSSSVDQAGEDTGLESGLASGFMIIQEDDNGLLENTSNAFPDQETTSPGGSEEEENHTATFPTPYTNLTEAEGNVPENLQNSTQIATDATDASSPPPTSSGAGSDSGSGETEDIMTTAVMGVVPESTTGGGAAVPDAVPESTTGGGAVVQDAVPESTTGGGAAVPEAVPESTTGGGGAVPDAVPESTTGGGAAVPDAVPESTTGGGAAVPEAVPESTTGGGAAVPDAVPESTTGGGAAVPDAVPESTTGVLLFAATSPDRSNLLEKGAGVESGTEDTGLVSESEAERRRRKGAWGAVLGTSVAVAMVGLVAYVILKKKHHKAFSHRKLEEDFPSDPVLRLDNTEPLDLDFSRAAYYNPALQGDHIQMSPFPKP